MKQLTIAVPAYNSEEYLDKCLESFVYADGSIDEGSAADSGSAEGSATGAESFSTKAGSIDPRLEIIVVNDGSTDSTSEIAHGWEARFPGIIRVIDKANGGHGSGINVGIDAATGRYFKVIDSDDWVVTENIKAILDELEETETDAVITGYHTINIASDVVLPYGTGQMPAPTADEVQKFGEDYAQLRCFGSRVVNMEDLMYDVDNIPAVQSFHGIMYRTDFYRETGIRMSEQVFFEDQEYAILPFAYVEDVLLLPYFFYEYRIGSADQSVNFENQARKAPHFLTVMEKMVDFHQQAQPLPLAQDAFIIWRLSNAAVSYYATVLIKGGDKDGGREKALAFQKYLEENEPEVAERTDRKFRAMLRLNKNPLTSRAYGKLFNSKLYDKFKKRWVR